MLLDTNRWRPALCTFFSEGDTSPYYSANDHEFPRGWILPVLKEHVKNTELGYFVQDLLPLAAKMRAKSNSGRGLAIAGSKRISL